MKNKRVTNKTFVLTATIGSILIMVIVMVNTIWSAKQTYTATDDAVSAISSFYLEAMADRRAKTITNLISNTTRSAFKKSPIKVMIPAFLPSVLKAFVVPALPLPISRIST